MVMSQRLEDIDIFYIIEIIQVNRPQINQHRMGHYYPRHPMRSYIPDQLEYKISGGNPTEILLQFKMWFVEKMPKPRRCSFRGHILLQRQ